VTLHRSLRTLHDSGDISLAEVGQVTQDDRLSLAAGQTSKSVHEVLALTDIGIDQAEGTVDA
jgi:hypothetical protein